MINHLKMFCFSIAFLAAFTLHSQDKYKEGVPGVYLRGDDGNYYLDTNNPETMWTGFWREDTNGWRVQVEIQGDIKFNPFIAVQVGSVKFNSGGGYVESPSGKFSKFELVDSNGTIVQPKNGESLEEHFSAKIPIRDFPKRSFDGALINFIAFFTNSPPSFLKGVSINDVYNIKTEGDYNLTVCVAIFKYGTSKGFLDRIDLPCITTKIHLRPNPEKQ